MEAGEGGDSGGKAYLGKLRILRVSGNKLQRLDGEFFPNLRTLYADNNALTGISHCGRMRRLENLSLRNQAKGKLWVVFFFSSAEIVGGFTKSQESFVTGRERHQAIISFG